MSYNVYIHTNKVNGKKYVGVTMKSPKVRWANGRGYKNNKHFTDAIKKYGWDNFDHFVVEVDTMEKMYQLEKQYIELYDTTNPDNGYNVSLGGDTGNYKGKNSDSKEYKKYYVDKWVNEHKEEYNEKRRNYYKKYYEENKDKINEKKRVYKKQRYELKKDELKAKRKIYRDTHKEKIREMKKKYYQKYKERIKEKERENYYKSKKANQEIVISPLF
jgi:hypothetical protein